MVDISQVFSGETLKAADLQNREHTVVIAAVEVKEFNDGNKLIIRFDGKKKALVCNKTNASRIGIIAGSTNTDAWIGRQIVLAPELVDFRGESVWAIRVKPPGSPAPGQPQPAGASVAAGQYRSPRSAPANQMPVEQELDDDIPF